MTEQRDRSDSWVSGAAYWLGDVVGRAARPLHRLSGRLARGDGERPRALRDRRAVRKPAAEQRRAAPGASTMTMSDAARAAAQLGLLGLAGELSSPHPEARRAALETVGELAEERATRLVLAALHDPDADVRVAAAAAAARAGASAAVFALILALDDPAPEVRQTAAMAIEEIANTRVDLEVGADAATRQRVIAELKQWWKQQRLAQLARAVQKRGP